MGILDIFRGGTAAEKAQKLKSKITQKYGDPLTRQKAIETLGTLRIPESVQVLLHRFTLSVEPATIDADEKDRVFEIVKGFGDQAISPLKRFLRSSDSGISWVLRVLAALLPEEDYVGVLTDELTYLGSTYTRTHEKKVILLRALEGMDDPRIAPAVMPLLDDTADDVQVAALDVLGPRKYEPAREPILALLQNEASSRRVQTAVIDALAASGFEVGEHKTQVQPLLGERFTLDGKGVLHPRPAS